MKTREYDLNVYVTGGVARLSAYEYTYSDSDDPQPNGTEMSRFVTLEVPMDEAHREEVSFLLGTTNWSVSSEEDWEDYDSPWDSLAWLEKAPASIRAWGDSLPEYEPTTQHEWEMYTMDLEYGERRDVKCLNCEATFPLVRLSWDEMRSVR